MDILERLRDPEYDWCNNNKKCNGPMFMQAADEIERLRHEFRELHADISMFMKDGPLKQDLLEDIIDVLGEGGDEKRTLD